MEGDFPHLPPDEIDPDAREISDEPDSEENALRDLELPEIEEAPSFEPLNRPEDLIAKEVGNALSGYGWHDVSNISAGELFGLCEDLNIDPEILGATTAIEDLGFWIEEKNFDARALTRTVGLEEIIDEAKSQDFESHQTRKTDLAVLLLNDLVRDPVIQKQPLLDRRIDALKELDQARKIKAKTYEEYTVTQARLEAYSRELKAVEEEIDGLLGIKAVNMRRDRAYRRMGWLLQQDFMAGPIADLKAHYAAKGRMPTFHELAEAIAGTYRDAFKESSKGPENESVEEIRVPGIIDKLIEEHTLMVTTQAGKTNTDRENEALMTKRLLQAKALCERVFGNDLDDGIYLPSPISEREYNLLHFVDRRLFMHSDKEIMVQFVSFLPGSNLRNLDSGEMEDVPLLRFSGRSLNELLLEVDKIIQRHPVLDRKKIEELVIEAEQDEISPDDYMALMADAYKILEKLAYREKHSVGQLISPE